jgi:hypothetical protein
MAHAAPLAASTGESLRWAVAVEPDPPATRGGTGCSARKAAPVLCRAPRCCSFLVLGGKFSRVLAHSCPIKLSRSASLDTSVAAVRAAAVRTVSLQLRRRLLSAVVMGPMVYPKAACPTDEPPPALASAVVRCGGRTSRATLESPPPAPACARTSSTRSARLTSAPVVAFAVAIGASMSPGADVTDQREAWPSHIAQRLFTTIGIRDTT